MHCKNSVKVGNLKKKIEDQNKINVKLRKINSDLEEEAQLIEEENEDWMKRCEEFKELYGNVVSQLQNINHKVEELVKEVKLFED